MHNFIEILLGNLAFLFSNLLVIATGESKGRARNITRKALLHEVYTLCGRACMCALLETVASTLQYVTEEIGEGSNSLCINVLCVLSSVTIFLFAGL